MNISIPKYFTMDIFKITGIYFLIKNNKIVYIGQTVNMLNRLAIGTYHPCKSYDYIRIILCPKETMRMYEKRWISKFNPKYNIMHVTRQTRRKRAPILYIQKGGISNEKK